LLKKRKYLETKRAITRRKINEKEKRRWKKKKGYKVIIKREDEKASDNRKKKKKEKNLIKLNSKGEKTVTASSRLVFLDKRGPINNILQNLD